MFDFTFSFRRALQVRRLSSFFVVIGALSMFGNRATAHPLGNFTTNTATVLEITRSGPKVAYYVDLAEIPALKARQEMGAPKGSVPLAAATQWRDKQCREIGQRLRLARNGNPVVLSIGPGSEITFPDGQAGLTTLRLECRFSSPWPPLSTASLTWDDGNFTDRIGWREITASGNGMTLLGDVSAVSPTRLLLDYSRAAPTSPLRQLDVTFKASSSSSSPSGSALVEPVSTGESVSASTIARGNDGLTKRFQSLLNQRSLTFSFIVGALLLSILLGGLHALAPGHGKTIIAAYALGSRGRTADIVAIGGTVAATHTIGILLLGILVSATTVVSPDKSLRWASVVSGMLVIGVGFTLLRSRLRLFRLPTRPRKHNNPQGFALPDNHPHPHSHDDHKHDEHDHHKHNHDHDHNDHDHKHEEHGHSHSHDLHPTAREVNRGAAALPHAHPEDPRFIVTSHSHGGWSHDHVLPAPGAVVRRRELVMMGLAGGLVPSPSALVVLLGAIAIGRVPFGVALVVAYGIGLAATLVGAGLLMVRFEQGLRGWSSKLSAAGGARLQLVSNALPLVSGFAIAAAGIVLFARSIGNL